VQAIELSEDLHSRRVLAHALRLTGEAAAWSGSLPEASQLLGRAADAARDLQAPAEVAGVLCSQACVALGEGSYEQARQLAGEAAALAALAHTMRRVDPDWVVGMAAARVGDLPGAATSLSRGLRQAERIRSPRHVANHRYGLGEVARLEGRLPEAARHHAHALGLRAVLPDSLGVADSLVALASTVAGHDPVAASGLLRVAQDERGRAGAVPTPDEQARVDEVASRPGVVVDAGAEMPLETALALAREVATMLGGDAAADPAAG
jgi:hypothetical protein